MLLDDFKLAAFSKSQGVGHEYKVIVSEELGGGQARHVVSVEHKGVPLYFNLETNEDILFSFDYLMKLAEDEIWALDHVLLEPSRSEQIDFIMYNYENIFAYQSHYHDLDINTNILNNILKYVEELVDKNNKDILKTYKELVEFIYQDSPCFESII